MAHHRFARRAESDGARKLRVEEVPREDRLGLAIERRVHLMLRVFAEASKRPFGVRRYRELARPDAPVRQPEKRHLHGSVVDHGERETRRNARVLVLERRATRPVTNREETIPSHRRRRRAPRFGGLFVAKVEYFARRIAHWIIVPRRESKELTVLGPRAARAALGNEKTAVSVGDDVRPRRRWNTIAADAHFVLALRRDPTEAVVEAQWCELRAGARGLSAHVAHRTRWPRIRAGEIQRAFRRRPDADASHAECRCMPSRRPRWTRKEILLLALNSDIVRRIDDRAERTAVARNVESRRRAQHEEVVVDHQIAAPHEHPARLIDDR